LVLIGRYQSVKKLELINRKAVSKKKKRVLFYKLIIIKKGVEDSINIGKGL